MSERSQNRFVREKLQRERIVHFNGSRIVKNDYRQLDGDFGFGNCECLDVVVRTNP
jgi:hypothetical protein